MQILKMLWFFIGFIFGVFVAQESPTFPNVKQTGKKIQKFAYEILIDDKQKQDNGVRVTRSKSE
jgi:hypothetical protein